MSEEHMAMLIGLPLGLVIGLLLFALIIVAGSAPQGGESGQVEPNRPVHPPRRPAGSKPPRHPERRH